MKITRDRILELKQALGLKQNTDFATMLNITPQVLNYWLKSDFINEDIILAKIPNINPIWLMTGNGEIFISQEKSNHNIIANATNNSSATNNVDNSSKDFIKLLEKKDEQMDRLLTIIERLTNEGTH